MSLSVLTDFRAIEQQLATLSATRDELATKVEPQIAFLKEVEARAAELGLTNTDVALYLDPSLQRSEKPAKAQRKPHKPRELKVYIHPTTGERVETKGGNHKILKEWKAEHGAETVESWRVTDAA